MLNTNSIATVGNRNKYGANREPHRDGLGGVSSDLASAGDVVLGALIGRARLPNGLKSFVVSSLAHLLVLAIQFRSSDITQIDHSFLG